MYNLFVLLEAAGKFNELYPDKLSGLKNVERLAEGSGKQSCTQAFEWITWKEKYQQLINYSSVSIETRRI